MRYKAIIVLLIILLFLVACKQTVKEEVMKKETPKVEVTGDAAVDSVGNDLNNVDSVENELNVDELNDLDSGLSDIENI